MPIMIERFRLWLRDWLQMDCITVSEFAAYKEDVQQTIFLLQDQITQIKVALRAKASERRVPRVAYDFESAQQEALHEFEEKPNGVR